MTKRSTLKIGEIVDMANDILLHSPDKSREWRLAIKSFTDDMLHKTGNYQGFSYLRDTDMARSRDGKSLGIIFDAVNHNHQYPDDSRVCIHYRKK